MTSMTSNPLDTQVGGDHYKGLKIQPVEYIKCDVIIKDPKDET